MKEQTIKFSVKENYRACAEDDIPTYSITAEITTIEKETFDVPVEREQCLESFLNFITRKARLGITCQQKR